MGLFGLCKTIISEKRFTSSEKLILIAMILENGTDKELKISNVELGKLIGIDKRTIQRSLIIFEAKGFVKYKTIHRNIKSKEIDSTQLLKFLKEKNNGKKTSEAA